MARILPKQTASGEQNSLYLFWSPTFQKRFPWLWKEECFSLIICTALLSGHLFPQLFIILPPLLGSHIWENRKKNPAQSHLTLVRSTTNTTSFYFFLQGKCSMEDPPGMGQYDSTCAGLKTDHFKSSKPRGPVKIYRSLAR